MTTRPFSATHRPTQVYNGKTRPKLLFLACAFPPAKAIASIRAWNIAKYLARLGWDVRVVTLDPSIWRNAEDRERVTAELEQEGIRRITTGHRWRCLAPDHLNCWNEGFGWLVGGLCRKVARYLCVDSGIGWKREVEKACSSLTANEVDVILATGDPFATFSLAKSLSMRLDRPYVLDYRDPWTLPSFGKPLRKRVHRLEANLVSSASAVTVVSKSLLNPSVGREVHVITNGFDPDEMAKVKPYDFQHSAIVYAGTFHPQKIVITPVMKALRRLRETTLRQKMEWRFHYYGPQAEHVLDEAERADVTECVVVHGMVARAEVLSAVRGSAVTVVITSVLEERAAKDKCIVTGKLFDALGLRVPVLVIGPSGSDVEAIIETSGSARLVTARNIDGMVSFFAQVMSGNVPRVKCPETYAWPNIIIRLNHILRECIAPRVPSRDSVGVA